MPLLSRDAAACHEHGVTGSKECRQQRPHAGDRRGAKSTRGTSCENQSSQRLHGYKYDGRVAVSDTNTASLARPSATRTQHAVRLLVLLAQCGELPTNLDPPGMSSVVRSELRLQATDFWLRNPDYLADELITMMESGTIDSSYSTVAQGLIDNGEPDLRYYPMPKWLHGAYEPLDDAFSLLETYGLATAVRRGTPGQTVSQTQFFLTSAGAEAVVEIAKDPVLGWYAQQVELVALVAGDDLGSRLKERQYLQATYANTELGLNIASIADRVRKRLAEIMTSTEAKEI